MSKIPFPPLCLRAFVRVIALAPALSTPALAEINLEEFSSKLGEVAEFQYGKNDGSIKWLESAVTTAFNEDAQRAEVEAAILKTLEASSTAPAKVFLCKQLRIIGSDASIPVLAKLLPDRELSHAARYALGSIGTEKSLVALVDAIGKVDRQIEIGIINTLGDHRYAPAGDTIGAILRRKPDAKSKAVQQPALRALGQLGRYDLLKGLKYATPDMAITLATAKLKAAEAVLATGDKKAAEAIYRDLYGSAKAGHVRVAALKGLSQLGGKNSIDLLEKAAVDSDLTLARAAIRYLSQAGGEGPGRLAGLMHGLAPESQAAALLALGNLADPTLISLILPCTFAESEPIRITALTALGYTGGDEAAIFLARAAASREGDEERAARDALRSLPDNFDPNKALDALARGEDTEPLERLISACGDRGEPSTCDRLLKFTAHDSSAVRRESLRALGKFAKPAQSKPLLAMLRDPGEADRKDVAGALSQIFGRSGDTAAAAKLLLAAGKSLPSKARPPWVRLLGRCATAETLEAATKATRDSDPEVAEAAVRTLVSWPNRDATSALLVIATKPKVPTWGDAAFDGYVRLAKDASNRGALLAKAMPLAKTAAQKRLILGAITRSDELAALDIAEPLLGHAELKDEAAVAAAEIASRIYKNHPERAKKAAEKVLATSKNEHANRKAREVLDRLK